MFFIDDYLIELLCISTGFIIFFTYYLVSAKKSVDENPALNEREELVEKLRLKNNLVEPLKSRISVLNKKKELPVILTKKEKNTTINKNQELSLRLKKIEELELRNKLLTELKSKSDSKCEEIKCVKALEVMRSSKKALEVMRDNFEKNSDFIIKANIMKYTSYFKNNNIKGSVEGELDIIAVDRKKIFSSFSEIIVELDSSLNNFDNRDSNPINKKRSFK